MYLDGQRVLRLEGRYYALQEVCSHAQPGPGLWRPAFNLSTGAVGG